MPISRASSPPEQALQQAAGGAGRRRPGGLGGEARLEERGSEEFIEPLRRNLGREEGELPRGPGAGGGRGGGALLHQSGTKRGTSFQPSTAGPAATSTTSGQSISWEEAPPWYPHFFIP